MKLHVRKGDNVKILTGKDKGKTGKISMVDPDSGRVVVENNNIIIKHVKGRGQGQTSSIQKVPGSIDASNVQIVCPKCGKTTRVGHAEVPAKKAGKTKWQRVCKKCGAALDVKAAKAADKKSVKKSSKKDDAADGAEAAKTADKPAKKTKVKIEKNEDGAVV